MKLEKLLFFCLILPGIFQAESDVVDTDSLIMIDQIECVVCGPENNTPFVDTDKTWKRDLEGRFIPMEAQLRQDVVLQQIASEKVPMDPTAADKYIESMKKQNNLTEADLAELFAQVGRVVSEGYEFLRNQYMQEFFMHYKFKSQLVATEDEINTFFNEYPEFIAGWIDVQMAVVPYETNSRESIKQQIEDCIKNNSFETGPVIWNAVTRVLVDDLSSDQKFLEDMQEQQIVVHESEGVFELYRVIAQQPNKIRPLEERRSSIIDFLNRKKLEKMFQDYNNSINEFVDLIPLVQDAEENS